MRRRYELSNRQWERLEHSLPHPTHHGGKGHPWKPHRDILNGIPWILHTGAPWRDLPERYGPWQTVYDRFNHWRRHGTWATILTHLLDHLERHGRLGRHLWFIDATIIRATRAAGGAEKHPDPRPLLGGPKAVQLLESEDHELGYSRGGFGIKISLLGEEHGIPLGVYLRAGQRHESVAFAPTMGRVLLPHRRGRQLWPEKLGADKGYSYPHIRHMIRLHLGDMKRQISRPDKRSSGLYSCCLSAIGRPPLHLIARTASRVPGRPLWMAKRSTVSTTGRRGRGR